VYEASARQKLEVGADNVDGLIVTLGLGATLRGRVLVAGPGSPMLERIGVSLQPLDEDEQPGGYGRVNKDRTFEIPAVQEGNYAVQVWGVEEKWYLKSTRLGGEDVLTDGLQLEKGAISGTLEVTVSSASAQLEGSISDDDGPVTGAKVRATIKRANSR
jgi:hypothetical protein